MTQGQEDFRAFCASGSSVKSFERTIYQADIFSRGKLLVFRITADGFLYKMVRTVVGTLLEIGKGNNLRNGWKALSKGGKDKSRSHRPAPGSGSGKSLVC
ncbi:MAG: hypothetical protein ACOX2P_05980 [Bacillota bacterium]